MSISFSGLASGLDTTSWITSLTSLRQAKVVKFEEQKQEVVTAQATLSSIRSIFASFRASLEKITDSKFNVSSMDIFSKKLAAVSNAAILSATAKSNAAEGSYAVKVKNIATQTKVKSGYRYKTTLVSTTQATTSSSLKDVGIGYGTNPEQGITAGDIEIDHNDVTSRISISEDETMSSFLQKLHDAGINAEFDNSTGIFSIDVNVGDIRDIGNTNILNKLKISDINYGYTGEQLKIEDTHEEYHQATSETLLSDLGVSVGTIAISTANGDYEVTLDEEDTIGSLVSALRSEGIEATFNEGIFSITNANITNDGTTGLIAHFGLTTPDIASQTQISDGLTYQTVYSETTTAQLNSYLKDIDGVTLESDQTIKVKNADGVLSTITVGTTTKISDMLAMLNDEDVGLDVTYNETTGVLSINDGWIVAGGTFDVEAAFGLEYTGVPATVTGNTLTVTTTTVSGATSATKLKDLTTAVTSGTVEVTDTTDTVHNLVIDENSTIGELVSQIRGLGLGADFDNTTGVLTLTGGSYTTDGVSNASNFLNVFFGSDTLTPNAIDSATSVSQSLREGVVTTHVAEGTTTLNQLGLSEGTFTATFTTGLTEAEVEIDGSMTMTELVSALRTAGVDASFDAGTSKLILTDAEFSGVTGGNFDTIMNFAETITGRYVTSDSVTSQTVTIGKEMTSAGIVYHTIYNTSTISTTISTTSPIVTTSGVLSYQSVTTTQTAGTQGITINGITITYTDVTSAAAVQTSGTLTYESITPSTTTTVGETLTGGTIYTSATTAIEQTNVLNYTTVNITPGTTTTVGATQSGTTIYTSTTSAVEQTSSLTYTSVTPSSTTTVGATLTSTTIYTSATSAIEQTSSLTYTSVNVTPSSTVTVGQTATGSAIYTYTTTAAQQTSALTCTNPMSITTSETTMAELGLSQDGYIVNNAGNTVTIQTTDTVDSVVVKINSLDITASFSEGNLTVGDSGDTKFITSLSSRVSSVLGIDAGESASYISGGVVTADASKTLAELGMTGATGTIVTDNWTYTVSSTNTLQDVMDMLDGTYGMPDWFTTVKANSGTIGGVSLEDLAAANNGFISEITTIAPEITVVNAADLASALSTYTTIGIGSSEALAELAKIVNGTNGYSANNCAGKTIVLTTDLDISTICAENTVDGVGGWTAIGTATNKFQGNFDGNGHTVSGLYINRTNASNQGLFGCAEGELRNVGVEGEVHGNIRCGLLAGYSYNSNNSLNQISNCHASGSISGTQYTGGLIGYNNSTIINSYTMCDVTGSDSNTGGLVGYAKYIATCFATGDVVGNDDVGGLAGKGSGLFTNCYTTGNVSGNDNIGGIVGNSAYTAIYDSYATGDVSGHDYVGGLAGHMSGGGVRYGYATGNVTGNAWVGGISGISDKISSSTTYYSVVAGGTVSGSDKVGNFIGGIVDYQDETSYATLFLISNNAAVSQGDMIGFEGQSDGTAYDSGRMSIWESSCSDISPYGIFETSLENGQLTITPTDGHYLRSMSSNLETVLGINSGYNDTYEVNIDNGSTTTNTITTTGETTMAQLGLAQNGIVMNNAGATITVLTTDTVNSVVTKFGDLGITASFAAGNLTVGDDGDSNVITNISSGVASVLGIEAGEGLSYSVESGVTATSSKTLAELGMTGETGVIVTDSWTYTVSSTNTLQDVMDMLDGTYGMPDWFTTVQASAGKIGGIKLEDLAAANGGFISEVIMDTPEITVVNAADLASALSTYTTIGIGSSEALAELAKIVNGTNGYSANDCLGKTIVLTTDLDISTICEANTDSEGVGGWTAIGTSDISFAGTFNGNGHTVSGLYINRTNTNYQGLFGSVTGEIKNLGVEGSVSGNNYVGGLAGSNTGNGIINCYSNVDVTGYNYTGGLVGSAYLAITDCYSTGSVSGNDYVGGLCGDKVYTQYTSIKNCYTTGSVTGNSRVGGVVGDLSNDIKNSYATGSVTGNSRVGGVVGHGNRIINECYSEGDITGNTYVGGIAGYISKDIYNSYAIGAVTGNTWVGGAVGEAYNVSALLIGFEKILADGKVSGNDKVGSLIGGVCNTTNGASFGEIYLSRTAALSQGDIVGFEGTSGGTAYESGQMDGWIANCTELLYPIGITETALENGQLGITPVNGHFIKSMSSNLESLLGINTGYGESYELDITEQTTTLVSATGSTTMAELGLSQTGTIVNNQGSTVTIQTTDTLNSVIVKFGSLGIDASLTNGSLTVGNTTDCNYITGISTGVASALGIEAGDGNSYSIESGINATSSMTLAELGMTGSSGTIVTDFGTYTVSATDTLNDVMNLLESVEMPAWTSSTSLVNAGTVGGVKLEDLAADDGFINDVDTSTPTTIVVDPTQLSSAISSNSIIGIGNAETLAKLAELSQHNNFFGKTFVLTDDIDLSDYCAANMDDNGQGGWTAIGTTSSSFGGTFNGNGHKITGLYINNENSDYQGLFGVVYSNGTVKNLAVEDAYVNGNNAVGAIVGLNRGSIINCYATGHVSGQGNYTGGLAGDCSGKISYCYSDCDVVGETRVGGLVGYITTCTVSNSYATGNVSGDSYTGGLIGYGYINSTVSNCYTTGDVSGQNNTGGLIGYSRSCTVSTSYASGDVSGETRVGGLIGNVYLGATYNSCYATGNVSGDSFVGGLAGDCSGNISYCYATGDVSGSTLVGGMCGKLVLPSGEITLDYVLASGEVNGDTMVGAFAGGILNTTDGTNFSTINISNSCVNTHDLDMTSGTYIISDGYPEIEYDMTDWLDNIDTLSTCMNVSFNNGQLSITPEDGHYIKSISSNLETILGINTGYGESYGVDITEEVRTTETVAATGTTTMAELGLNQDGIVVNNTGNTVTILTTDNLSSVNNKLRSLGISASLNCGTLKVGNTSEGNYITNISSGVASVLGIEIGEGLSYSVEEGVTATASSTLASLGMSGASGVITTDFATITVLATDTLQEVTNKIYNYSMPDWIDNVGTIGNLSLSEIAAGNNGFISHFDIVNRPDVNVSRADDLLAAIRRYTIIGIENADVLAELANIVNSGEDCKNKTFVLTNDIVLNNDDSLLPIGDNRNAFAGTFDGQGHVISGLNINDDTDYQGLFGYVTGEIKNLGVEGAVQGKDNVGILAGYAATISNCYTTGSVIGGDYTGGLVGHADSIINCYSTAAVEGDRNTGGLAGMAALIRSCYTTGSVEGDREDNIGGLVGSATDILDSYSESTVIGNNCIGGLCGYSDGNILNCYASGNISGTGNYIGGLIGQWENTDSRATVTLSGSYTKSELVVNNNADAVGELIGGIYYTNDGRDFGSFAFRNLFARSAETAIGFLGDSSLTPYDDDDCTAKNFISNLSTAKICASIQNGQFTITPNEGHYLKSMSSNLETVLGINTGFGESYGIDITEQTTNIVTATNGTTLAKIGLNTNGYIVSSNGNTITVLTTDTISTLSFNLSNTGGISSLLTSGQFTLGNAEDEYFVTSMSSNIASVLGLEAGDGYSFTISTDTVGATTETVLSTLGMTSDGYIVTNGSTITISRSATIQDVLDELNTAGFSAELADSALNITATDGHYITSVTSNLANALNIEAGYNISYEDIPEITTTNAVTATTATTLSTLGLTENGTIVTNNSTLTVQSTDNMQDLIDNLDAIGITALFNEETGIFSLGDSEDTNFIKSMSSNLTSVLGNISVGEDYSYTLGSRVDEEEVVTTNLASVTLAQTFGDIGITTESVLSLSNGETVTVDSSTTFSDFIGDMSDNGISVTLVNGIFNIASGTPYITGYTGENVLNAMNIVGSTYQVTDLSLGNTKLMDLKDNLGNLLGITSGAITAYKSGIANNIYIDNNSTLDDLASQLSNYNIQMVYGSGNNGRIYFTSAGDSYLASVADGSNILSALNIQSWTEVKDTESSALKYTTGNDVVINGDTKLVDLKNSSGDSLGITAGKYKLVAAGINYEGTITASTSVNDLFTDLARYGFTGSINSDGQITLNTTNDNTYLVKANGAEGYSNIVDTVFSSWTFGNIYESSAMDVTETETHNITRDTKLLDLGWDRRNGIIRILDIRTNSFLDNINISNVNSTVGDVMDALSMYGFNSYINNGSLHIMNDGYKTLRTPAGTNNILSILDIDTSAWEEPGYYTGSAQTATTYNTVLEAATRSTLLSNLRDAEGNELGITTGNYLIHSNGIAHTVNLASTDITLDSFMNTLEGYGINTIFDTSDGQSILKIVGSGDSYVESLTGGGASNVINKLFNDVAPSTLYNYSGYQQTTELVSTTVIATLGTSVSDYNNGENLSEGIFALTVDGKYSEINITSYETFGSLIEKFERAGVQASLTDGVLRLETGNRNFTVDTEHTTSHLLDNLGLHFSDNLGGFAASCDSVTQTTTTIEDRTLSVAKYADYDTQMSLLNISSGTLSVYRNGEKKLITIDNTETFGDFRTKLQTAFDNVDIDFIDGKLRFFSTSEGVDVQIGSSNDTSNISSICGFSQSEEGYIMSARELYKVNASSKLTTSNLFRLGDVTEGTFTIGDAEFTIDNNTTMQSLIAQINSSDKANASAYWDSVDGKLVISSRTTGASIVNVEAGTSNFTDILGLTNSEWNLDGSIQTTRIALDSQEIGENAKFSINGTNFQSASNVITSDVSRIQGLTFNLKSTGSATVEVHQDAEAVTEAVGEFVESYNELVENVEAELSSTGVLKDQSTLRFIKQQIRSLLVNTFGGATTFRNLAALGISTNAGNSASATDTSASTIEYLHFDAEKFMDGYNKDAEAVKNMLVGSDSNQGILLQIQNIVANALSSGTGYFASANKSFTDKITSINEKIKKENQAIEAYRARLERQFKSMDMLISQMQNQYNSFLSQGTTTAATTTTSFYGL